VFDGRVRNGNGSDHSFMATKNWNIKERPAGVEDSEDCTQVGSMGW
jgi:hypothetical protein